MRDRTGQTWDLGDDNPYLVLGPSRVDPTNQARLWHPAVKLDTGVTFDVAEWTSFSWEEMSETHLRLGEEDGP